MMILLLQMFLLLLAAYLLGATTACLLKRVFASQPAERYDLAVPVAVGAARGAANEGDRFGKALTGGVLAGGEPASRPGAPVVEMQPPPPKPPVAEVPPPRPVPEPTAPLVRPAPAPVPAVAPKPMPRTVTVEPASQPRPAEPPVRPVAPPSAPPQPKPEDMVSRPAAAASSGVDVGAAAATAAAAASAAASARSAPTVVASVSPASAASPPAPAQDLTRIRAIDAELQKRLNSFGVLRFEQIAAWGAADVSRMSQSLGFAGRIEQENWIEQAQILARGGETDYAQRRDNGAAGVQNSAAHSPQQDTATAIAAATAAATRVATVLQGPRPAKLDEAIREHAAKAATAPGRVSQPVEADVRSDMAALRSVRSEALRGDHAPIAQRPIGQVDDLKRVRGIGVLIEKKLNSLGITTYEQVANWTGADIDRISQILDFKGRIERENWVEQARILASGGQTEFARRFDRGEVDMGR